MVSMSMHLVNVAKMRTAQTCVRSSWRQISVTAIALRPAATGRLAASVPSRIRLTGTNEGLTHVVTLSLDIRCRGQQPRSDPATTNVHRVQGVVIWSLAK
jgi:hypothetical protein